MTEISVDAKMWAELSVSIIIKGIGLESPFPALPENLTLTDHSLFGIDSHPSQKILTCQKSCAVGSVHVSFSFSGTRKRRQLASCLGPGVREV